MCDNSFINLPLPLEGMLSKPTLLCSDGMVSVHCHSDCHLQSDCRRDCSLGAGRWMLVATRLTWVAVAMSTKPGDRHHFGGRLVAVFEDWVWVLGIGLQMGRRSWVAQSTFEGGHHVWVLVTHLGWVGTHVGCQRRPTGHYYVGHFNSIFLAGSHSPRVTATQPLPDCPAWTVVCTNRRYCSTWNPRVGGNNIFLNLHAEALFATRFAPDLWVWTGHNGWWRQ